METNQENILIAKFMGIELFGKDKNHTEALLICSALDLSVNPLIHFEHISETINVDDFKFDSSWDWLMPCIQNILELDEVTEDMEKYYTIIDNVPDIKATYKSVVSFLKTLND